ncbi:hypothetical protein JCM3774_005872 [Rhodotorula dairenensis]
MTTTATHAVRLPPCASLYASTSAVSVPRPSRAGDAAKSESEDATLVAKFAPPAPQPAPGPTCSASLAHYALGPTSSVPSSALRLGEARPRTSAGEPSHPSLSAAAATAHSLVPPSSALAQPDLHARTAAAVASSPRARQRSLSPASQPSAAETTAKPPRSLDNLLATPRHGLVNASQWTVPWGLYTAASTTLNNAPPTHRVAPSTAPSSPGRSSISGLSAFSAPEHGTQFAASPPYAGSTTVSAPYPPTDPREPAPVTLHGGTASGSARQLGDALCSTSTEPKPPIGRAVSASLSAQEEVVDDSGAASGSQGEGYPCQDKIGGKPKKELKGSKRAEQNRAAQRAFRERKEQKLRSLQELVARIPELEDRLASVSAHCSALEADRAAFLAERQSFANERASWDRERRCLLGEIDALRRVLSVEKPVSTTTLPAAAAPVPSAMAPVGPLSPRSGSGGSHSAETSPSPSASALAPQTTLPRTVDRPPSPSTVGSAVKREVPDDFDPPRHPSKRIDLCARETVPWLPIPLYREQSSDRSIINLPFSRT